MAVKNPKLLETFEYKGYVVDNDAELKLNYLENCWKFDGRLINQNNGDSFEMSLEEEGPDQLVESLKNRIDQSI